MVDTWLGDHEVPCSSRGSARSTLSPWERLFVCIFLTPLVYEYPTIGSVLEWRVICNDSSSAMLPQGVEEDLVGMACRGPHVKSVHKQVKRHQQDGHVVRKPRGELGVQDDLCPWSTSQGFLL